MKKHVLLALAVLLAAGFSTQSLAAQGATGPTAPVRPALTQAQIVKMKADRDAARTTMKSQRDQMKGLTDQLSAELKKKPVDKNRINDLTKQIDIQRDTMQIQMMQMMMSQNPNLKPADQTRYNNMIQKAKDRLAKRQSAP
jgi:hypothetical protein